MNETTICIRIKETLAEDWSGWFDGLLVRHDPNGNTILRGPVPDPSAIRGVLGKLWDLNLTVLSFSMVDKTGSQREKLA